jgi:alginate export protein
LDFNADTDLVYYSEMLTRIGVKAHPADEIWAYIQFQDNRTVGDFSGTAFEDNRDADLHQGYLVWKPQDYGWVKVGRFGMNFNSGRLVSDNWWNNVGRTFEGLRAGRDFEKFNFDLFLTHLSSTMNSATDNLFMGVNFNMEEIPLSVFGYLQRQEFNDDLTRMTFGAYYKDKMDDIDYMGTAAYQLGDYAVTNEDIAAYMVHAQAGYTWGCGLRTGFVFDMTSGDDAADATECGSFNNLFYDQHMYRGFMDYFTMSNDEGLIDMGLRASYPVLDGWKAKADYHYFSTVEDHAGGGTALGQEIDLSMVYKQKKFAWVSGMSMFLADDEAAGFNSDFSFVAGDQDIAMWMYSFFNVTF